MYNYKRAYVKENFHWKELNVSSLTLVVILNKYQNVRIIATHGTETMERGIDLKNNRYVLSKSDKSQTVTAWLTTLVEAEVVHDNVKVTFNSVRCVKHWNLFDLPVKVTGANARFGEGVPIPVGMTTDLMITSNVENEANELSTKNIAKNMLIAINGRVCKMDLVDGRAFAIDAYNKVSSNANVLSAIDFTDVGGLTQVNITEDMVTVIPQSPEEISMKRQRVTIELSEEVSGTTPILILDGYLHILDGSIKRVSGKLLEVTVRLDVALIRAGRHKAYVHDFVDNASLGGGGIDGNTFDVSKFLHQTDTFIAFVHNEDLCLFKEQLQQTKTLGGYEHYRAPKGIIVTDQMEYVPHIYEEVSATHLSISIGENIYDSSFVRDFNFNPASKFGDNRMNTKVRKYKKAYALEIYTF